MPNTRIPPGSYARFAVQGQDNSHVPQAAVGTAKISDYSKAYVAVTLPGVVNVVPKAIPPAGATVTVAATLKSFDVQSGAALPDFTETFDIVGPPLPQLATHLELLGGPDVLTGTPPADPGSDTVSI